MAERPKYQFKSVQLLKDQSLGIGSYGAVCKAKCDDLICAAKIIHPTLFDPTALHQITPPREHRLPIKRFEQECEFMSAIRHPNIVQYLGMFRDANTHLPVLLMELMDDSLTHFLESSTQPIPYHIQVNICHDVTLALSFLHSNNIVHRDLSSNNVLLIGNIRAKVTDFGMARLGDINPQATRFTNTMCPGTDVYMPPEAVQDKPVYSEKIDCFSFGVIIVQILTRQFPKPGDRLQQVELNHPGLPKRKLLMQIPEAERRQNHISQINLDHTLLPFALDCLKDEDGERPSAHQLCEGVANLKGTPKYKDSSSTIEDKEEVIQSLKVRMDEKDRTISSKEEENQRLRQQLQQERDQANRQLEERVRQLQQENEQASRGYRTQLQEKKRQLVRVNLQLLQLQLRKDQVLREKSRQMEEKERQLGRVNQQLEASEQVVAQFERRIAELEQQLSQREQEETKASSRGKEPTSFKLRWREGKRAPCRMNRCYDAVVDGNLVYIRNGDLVEIYSYDAISNSWSQLPNSIYESGSMAVINGWLTTVGGSSSSSERSNELFSLTRKGSNRRWTKKFPPMPTRRCWTTALCTGTTLIVAGGRGEGDRDLPIVEVMNTKTHQWSTAVDLPQPISLNVSTTVCAGQIYVMTTDGFLMSTQRVYTCALSTLLQSCVSSSLQLEANLKRLGIAQVWRQVADLPVTQSTCESFNDRLLAVGGSEDSRKSTTAVYMYNSTTNSWEIITLMTTGRSSCFTAVLPDNRLMVVGGVINAGSTTDSVELANMC